VSVKGTLEARTATASGEATLVLARGKLAAAAVLLHPRVGALSFSVGGLVATYASASNCGLAGRGIKIEVKK
jgi:hypothetical protein